MLGADPDTCHTTEMQKSPVPSPQLQPDPVTTLSGPISPDPASRVLWLCPGPSNISAAWIVGTDLPGSETHQQRYREDRTRCFCLPGPKALQTPWMGPVEVPLSLSLTTAWITAVLTRPGILQSRLRSHGRLEEELSFSDSFSSKFQFCFIKRNDHIYYLVLGWGT